MNPEICHGKPCIRGMRWPVEVIIDMLNSGISTEQILQDHPELYRLALIFLKAFSKTKQNLTRF